MLHYFNLYKYKMYTFHASISLLQLQIEIVLSNIFFSNFYNYNYTSNHFSSGLYFQRFEFSKMMLLVLKSHSHLVAVKQARVGFSLHLNEQVRDYNCMVYYMNLEKRVLTCLNLNMGSSDSSQLQISTKPSSRPTIRSRTPSAVMS